MPALSGSLVEPPLPQLRQKENQEETPKEGTLPHEQRRAHLALLPIVPHISGMSPGTATPKSVAERKSQAKGFIYCLAAWPGQSGPPQG